MGLPAEQWELHTMNLRPGSVPYGKVLFAFALSLALAVGLAAVIYVRYLRYERRAALHLPSATTFALRIDLEQGVMFEPFRRELLPLANTGSPTSFAMTRLERLEKYTKVEFGRDIRELVVAKGKNTWLLVVGGLFPRSGLLSGVARVLKDEEVKSELSSDRQLLLFGPRMAMAQASDGTILLGRDASVVREALAPQATHERLRLTMDGAGAFAVLNKAPQEVSGANPKDGRPRLSSISGTLKAGGRIQVSAHFDFVGGSPSKQLELARGILESVPGRSTADSSGLRALQSAIAGLELGAKDSVVLSASWHHEDLRGAAQWLAQVLRNTFEHSL